MRRAEPSQPNLFDLVELEDEKPVAVDCIADVEWSYSRRSLLEQCARRYYYAYYGANLRDAPDEPDKIRLHRLKKLQNRYTRAGKIVHLMIATYFRKAQHRDVWTLDRLIKWARE